MEVFDDSDKVVTDIVPLQGCPQSFVPNPVEGLQEVYEDVVEFFLFSTEEFYVKDLLLGASTCSEACLFFSNNILRLWLQSVQYDLQHDFAGVAD